VTRQERFGYPVIFAAEPAKAGNQGHVDEPDRRMAVKA